MDDADSSFGFFARGSLVAALVIVGVVASARGGVAVLSSASMGGGQMYFVRVRGILRLGRKSLFLLCWFYVASCCRHGRMYDQSENKRVET